MSYLVTYNPFTFLLDKIYLSGNMHTENAFDWFPLPPLSNNFETFLSSKSNSTLIPLPLGLIPDRVLPFGTLTLILYTFLVVLILIHHIVKTYLTRQARLLNKLPGAKLTLPLIGNSFMFLGPAWKTQEIFSNYAKKYGKVSRFWQGGRPFIVISDAEACKKILGSNDLYEKASGYDNLSDFAGVGLVTSQGERWKRDRKALNHAFNRQLFDGFVKIFDKESRTLVVKLEEMFKECNKQQNLYPTLVTAALEMIYQAALGLELNMQDSDSDNVTSTAIHTLLTGTHVRLFKPYLYKLPFVYRLMGKYQAEIKAFNHIAKTCDLARLRKGKEMKEAAASNNNEENKKIKTKPFLDILMEQTPPPTGSEYNQHLVTIVAAGAETTSSSIHLTLFFLAMYHDHQVKVHEEVDQIMVDLDANNQLTLTLAHLSNAKYLEMCWKEAIRIIPPVPIIGRLLTRDVQLDDGSILPKGADAVFVINDLHRDPSVYPDPEKFDPLRFSPEQCSQRGGYHYMPFSIGNRNCIGSKYAQTEALITLIHILRKFKVTTNQKQEDIKIIFGVPGIPDPHIELLLVPRRSSD